MNEEERIAFLNLQGRLAQQEVNQSKLNQAVTMFSGSDENDNLIKFQLEIDKTLIRIERMLRKMRPVVENNNIIYVEPFKEIICNQYMDNNGTVYTVTPDKKTIYSVKDKNGKEESIRNGMDGDLIKDLKLKYIGIKRTKILNQEELVLSDYGVTEILNILSTYVCKEIMLSCYTDQQIDTIMEQFGEEFNDFLSNNLEVLGMDTPEKKKHYPMIWMGIVNLVDATYRRALNGKENDNIKTSRVVTQTEPLLKNNLFPQINKQRFNILNPKSWKA